MSGYWLGLYVDAGALLIWAFIAAFVGSLVMYFWRQRFPVPKQDFFRQ